MGRVRSLFYTPDSQQLVVNNLDEVQVWGVATGSLLRVIADSATLEEVPTAFFSMALHPDGQTVAIGTREASIYLFDLTTGQQRLALSGHNDAVFSLAFSPDGQVLASGGRDNRILLWDVATGSELQRFSLDSTAYTLLFIPTGETLIAGSGNGQVSLWQRFTLPELIAWTQENRYLRPLTCSEREFYRVSPLCKEGQEVVTR
jgi:WD40 repeat protein